MITDTSSVAKIAVAISKRDARKAGLRYTVESSAGITRIARGKRFNYLRGKKIIHNPAVLKRIHSLVIPPAWTQVWISAETNGHIQATGRDARGRKQYRYHPRWTEIRDRNKYDHMLEFGRDLPRLRRQINRDLRLPGLPRAKVLAAVVRLLEKTLIRVGNDEYARQNHSYGLTTMRNRHVHVRGESIEFDFRGKSGKQHHIELDNPQLAKIIRKCQDLPGQDLFCYRDDDNQVRVVHSQDINEYLRERTGSDYTAKDFRTWNGTVLAALAFQELAEATSSTQAKQNVRTVIESVAKMLGNTPAICRKCYIHPEIILSYQEKTLVSSFAKKFAKPFRNSAHKLRVMETAVLSLLKKRQKLRSKQLFKA